MGLNRRHRQTSFRVVPEDWKVKKLGEIGSFKKGRTISRDQLSTEGKACVLYGEIYTRYDYVVKKLVSRIPDEVAKQSTSIRTGDILFAGSGETADEIGKCFAYVGAEDAYAGGDLIILSPEEDDSTFLGYQLNSTAVSRQKANMGQGSSVVHIYGSGLGSIDVAMPPLPEQRAIAGVLSDVDALVTALDRLIAKKRAIRQGAMQELLTGRTRLPGFSAEWDVRTVGEAFQFLQTANNSRSDLSRDGSVKYIHYGDIHTKWHAFLDCGSDDIPRIREDRLPRVPFLEDGDLVMVDASEDYEGIGASIEVRNTTGRRAVAGLHTLLLRGDKSVVADGFKGYMQYIPSFKQALIRIATGISVYGVSKSKMRQICIRLPALPEQRAIAAILSDMDAEISALEKQRDKIRAVKRGMMQELLTGRIRLV